MHAVIYADPEHPEHAQWVTCPESMLAVQELGTFAASKNCIQMHACNMGRSGSSGSRHGISVHSKWHQYLCSSSIPNYNPTATASHLIHNIDLKKPKILLLKLIKEQTAHLRLRSLHYSKCVEHFTVNVNYTATPVRESECETDLRGDCGW